MNDELIKRNKVLYICLIIYVWLWSGAYTFLLFINEIPPVAVIFNVICALVVTISGRIILKKDPESDRYRYIACAMMGTMFIGLLCLSKCDVVYTFGTIIVTVFIIYCEVKLIFRWIFHQ